MQFSLKSRADFSVIMTANRCKRFYLVDDRDAVIQLRLNLLRLFEVIRRLHFLRC